MWTELAGGEGMKDLWPGLRDFMQAASLGPLPGLWRGPKPVLTQLLTNIGLIRSKTYKSKPPFIPILFELKARFSE